MFYNVQSSPSFISHSQFFATHSSVWHALPISQTSHESSMNNGNTFNPGQPFNMADQTNGDDYLGDLVHNDLDTNFEPDFDPNFDYNAAFDPSLPALPFNDNSGYASNPLFEPQQSAPMQQQYNELPPNLTYGQAAPTLVPPPGYAYDPALGWYLPASMPAQQQMSTLAPYNAPLVVESIEKPEPSRPSTGKNKRKYGPAVYGEQQAKRRAIEGDESGPRPVSRDSVDFHVAGRKTKRKSSTASKPNQRAQKGGKLTVAELKKCRCPATEAVKDAHIRRPTNSWMLFRSDFSSEQSTVEGEKRGTGNPAISTLASIKWKANKDGLQARYKAMAAEVDRKHKERYPNYKYDTNVMYQAKFGRPDCTCGAYARNRAALLKKNGAGPSISETDHDADIGENEDDDNGEEERNVYVMPTTRLMSRSNSLAPAPIDQTNPYQFDFNLQDDSINVPDFGLSQNTAVNSQWYPQQNYTNAAETTYEPPVTRSSPRLVQQQQASGPFQDFSEDEADLDGDVEMFNTAPAPREKRRPSPITTSRNGSSSSPKMSDFVNISPESDGPASRTRSKSGSVSFDESQFHEASPGGDLFGDGWQAEDEDVGENIVVATPMTATSNVSPRNRSGLALPDRAARRQSRGSR